MGVNVGIKPKVKTYGVGSRPRNTKPKDVKLFIIGLL